MQKVSNRANLTEQQFDAWLKKYHSAEIVAQAQSLPLRQDMMTLLTFVRDNKVVGTSSTGNMPLKAVREVTARFVEPPKLETSIGGQTFRIRSEAELWPLYFLHSLADVGALLKIAPARRWQLGPQGEKFLDTPPLLQVLFLLSVWWTEVNWLIAYPFAGMGERLPPLFNRITLVRLRSLPVASQVSFTQFADGLIEKARMTWTAQDSSFAQTLLQGSIKRMVIGVLADFGAVKCRYQEKLVGRGTSSELVSFEITPLGKALLDAVAMVSG